MIVMRSHDQFEIHIDERPVGMPYRTLQQAESAYVSAMAETGVKIDARTVMVFQYIPDEPVYKLLRIR